MAEAGKNFYDPKHAPTDRTRPHKVLQACKGAWQHNGSLIRVHLKPNAHTSRLARDIHQTHPPCDVCIGYKGASCARERARRSARQSFLRASKKLERRRGLHAIELEALMAPKKKKAKRRAKLPEHTVTNAPAGLDMTKQGLEAPRPFILTHTSSIILLRPCRRTSMAEGTSQ